MDADAGAGSATEPPVGGEPAADPGVGAAAAPSWPGRGAGEHDPAPPRPRLAGRLALGLLLALAGAAILLVVTLDRKVVHSTSGRRPLPGFSHEVGVGITDAGGHTHALCMLVASTPAEQDRGLMGVHDRSLGGYDGMLFAFDHDDTGAFWMRDTPMPLSIAFVGRTGRVVSTRDMAPCGATGPCPTYPPKGPYRWAIEVPQGRLPAIGLDARSTFHVIGACPASG